MKLLVLILTVVCKAFAQTERGQMAGIVSDSSGAAIPAAQIQTNNARVSTSL